MLYDIIIRIKYESLYDRFILIVLETIVCLDPRLRPRFLIPYIPNHINKLKIFKNKNGHLFYHNEERTSR